MEKGASGSVAREGQGLNPLCESGGKIMKSFIPLSIDLYFKDLHFNKNWLCSCNPGNKAWERRIGAAFQKSRQAAVSCGAELMKLIKM